MEPLAKTRIILWEGASLWLVDALQGSAAEPRSTDFHSHHAIQFVLGLGGWFRLGTHDGVADGDIVAVAPDVPHIFQAHGRLAILFVEPESRVGRAVTNSYFRDSDLATPPDSLVALRADISVAWSEAGADHDALIALGRELVTALAGDARANAPDLRVRKVMAWATGNIHRPISLADALPVSGLSAGRLRHLFVEETGLPFKTYLLWLRLNRAVELAAAGASLTTAAHEAGFADSAHFSRTFRRMFGVTPAALRMS